MDINLMRNALVRFALTFRGVPYIYGGNNPDEGFDCSGFVCYVLRHFGLLPLEDISSAGLYKRFRMRVNEDAKPGDLIFFGHGSVSHVAFVATPTKMLECGGGGSMNKMIWDTLDDKDNPCVRVSEIKRRNDVIAVCDPFEGGA